LQRRSFRTIRISGTGKFSGKELLVAENGALRLLNGQGETPALSLSDTATFQLCQKLEIPCDITGAFPAICRRLSPITTLTGRTASRFFSAAKATDTRVSVVGLCRDNNSEIAETVETLLAKGDVTVKDFVLEETNMFLKFVSNEIWDVESGLKAGIMIGNSEVGMGSVSVEPFVFRKPCTNDLIVSQEKSFRHAHIHLTAHELTRRMAGCVFESPRGSDRRPF
jgi:hypothetical protein